MWSTAVGSQWTTHTRNFMESRFGYDFGSVQIHNDAMAHRSSADINALAYTHGNHVVFGNGHYQPNTDSGKKLLAHELTHVVQQSGAKTNGSIQRFPDDKHDLTSAALSGDPKLERCFDGEKLIKKPDKGEPVRKLQTALLGLGIPLPVHGADSDYGGETKEAVIEFQQKAGMSAEEQDGIVGKKTIGLLDKSSRNGVIEKDVDDAATDFTVSKPKANDTSCEGQPTESACTTADLAKIDAVATDSSTMVDKVLNEQLPPVKNSQADFPQIYTTIFKNDDKDSVNKVRQNYQTTQAFINNIKTDRSLVVCATACDGGCRSGSPAYASFQKKLGKKVIHFCPGLDKHPERVQIVLHESHHASIVGSRDFAYAETRLIDKIDFDTALKNAASFHLYASAVDKPAGTVIGQPVKDKNTLTDASQKQTVDLALAHLEQWFRLVTFDISVDIKAANDAKKKGRYESPAAERDMDIWADWFNTTRPPAPPKDADISKLKGIEERLNAMEKTFSRAFTITQTAGASNWIIGATSVNIELNKATVSLQERSLVIALLQELVNATSGISANVESLYVGSINDMRNTRQLAPQ